MTTGTDAENYVSVQGSSSSSLSRATAAVLREEYHARMDHLPVLLSAFACAMRTGAS